MEKELTASREKLQSSQDEIRNLQKNLETSAILSEEHSRLLEQNRKLEAKIANLKEEVDSARTQFEKTLSERDAEISKYTKDLSDASEQLLQEKSATNAHIANLQETIENIRLKLEKVSEDKLLFQNKVKDLEEANAEADKCSQELTQVAERLSEEKFMHEAEILTMQQSIGDLKSRTETLVQEKSLVTSWFTDLERVVEQGRVHVIDWSPPSFFSSSPVLPPPRSPTCHRSCPDQPTISDEPGSRCPSAASGLRLARSPNPSRDWASGMEAAEEDRVAATEEGRAAAAAEGHRAAAEGEDLAAAAEDRAVAEKDRATAKEEFRAAVE
ncbi:hypothetical protein PR202_ga23358 [Eleusine coracana subsp. coracana]|uniref:Uncharacterized protein n=1 Tax=Eleusine coracana subsp. coracana TaxID=191504 RepID=A0AAV5D618_ELECO|nr:hypothetical protein PR202_ga23358 [Eleusine coracana subsp. coracana]